MTPLRITEFDEIRGVESLSAESIVGRCPRRTRRSKKRHGVGEIA
jgi:hypothetical protein